MIALKILRRSLARRVGQLRDTLDGLRRRLHDTIVRVVGDAAADAVRDALQVVFAAAPVTGPTTFQGERSIHHSSRFWGTADDQLDDADALFDDDSQDPSCFRHRHDGDDENDVETPVVSSWPAVMEISCQSAAWWLRHRPHRSISTALLVGLIAGIAALGSTGLLAISFNTISSVLGVL